MMTKDEHQRAAELIASIDNHRQWIGQTTRELRDKVEYTGKNIETLGSNIVAATTQHKEVMDSLISALNRSSESSDKLSTKMIWLTVVLAIATLASAIASIVSLFHP